jgi:hypothetical protein
MVFIDCSWVGIAFRQLQPRQEPLPHNLRAVRSGLHTFLFPTRPVQENLRATRWEPLSKPWSRIVRPPAVPPTELTGPQVGELVHILSEGFVLNELVQLVHVTLDFELQQEINVAQSFKDTAYELVTWLIRHDEVDRFLQALHEARPQNLALKRFLFRVQGGQESFTGSQADAVGDAIGAVAHFVQSDPTVRQTVGQSRTLFVHTRDELGRVARYKGLHDCLHMVQLQLTAITRAVAGFPQDESSRSDLQGYLRELRRHALRARKNAAGLLSEADELVWIGDFDGALDLAQGGIDGEVAQPIVRAVAALGHLMTEMEHVNRDMTAAARRLVPYLTEIAKTNGSLLDILKPRNDNQDLMKQLRDGQEALLDLTPQLAGLVDTHNSWQQVDRALSAAATVETGPPADRVPRWTQIKALFARLCPRGPNPEVDRRSDLGHLAECWEKAGDSPASESLFRSLRDTAQQLFVQVDEQLLELTDQLTAVIQPLNALLQVI